MYSEYADKHSYNYIKFLNHILSMLCILVLCLLKVAENKMLIPHNNASALEEGQILNDLEFRRRQENKDNKK